jgi:hypothetical protein
VVLEEKVKVILMLLLVLLFLLVLGNIFLNLVMKSEVILEIVLYIVLGEVGGNHFMGKFGLGMKCIFYYLLLEKWVFIGKILVVKVILLIILWEIEVLVLR